MPLDKLMENVLQRDAVQRIARMGSVFSMAELISADSKMNPTQSKRVGAQLNVMLSLWLNEDRGTASTLHLIRISN